jgi:hypothetical protein
MLKSEISRSQGSAYEYDSYLGYSTCTQHITLKQKLTFVWTKENLLLCLVPWPLIYKSLQ